MFFSVSSTSRIILRQSTSLALHLKFFSIVNLEEYRSYCFIKRVFSLRRSNQWHMLTVLPWCLSEKIVVGTRITMNSISRRRESDVWDEDYPWRRPLCCSTNAARICWRRGGSSRGFVSWSKWEGRNVWISISLVCREERRIDPRNWKIFSIRDTCNACKAPGLFKRSNNSQMEAVPFPRKKRPLPSRSTRDRDYRISSNLSFVVPQLNSKGHRRRHPPRVSSGKNWPRTDGNLPKPYW